MNLSPVRAPSKIRRCGAPLRSGPVPVLVLELAKGGDVDDLYTCMCLLCVAVAVVAGGLSQGNGHIGEGSAMQALNWPKWRLEEACVG